MARLSGLSFILVVVLLSCQMSSANHSDKNNTAPDTLDYAIVIHGGAGFMTIDNLDAESAIKYELALDSALKIGLALLDKGGTSIDAVEQVINYLEDNPLFNAGKGAVFTNQGKNELDASIMTGADLQAGAIAGVTNIKNPISAARAVMEKSEHVMLSGSGASEFASENNLDLVDPSYFFTSKRYQSLQRALKNEKHGTVGCVALDRDRNLCAGTSTGGMTNKRYGRIGDSPIIGAGTYADNNTCGVSATGHGEYFIRYAVAYDITALMKYQDMTVEEAATEVLMHKLKDAGGDGGVICLDNCGNPAMIFNTTGMIRAYGNSNGEEMVAIFRD